MQEIMYLAPEIVLVATGLVILLTGVFLSPQSKNILGYLATLGTLAAIILTVKSFELLTMQGFQVGYSVFSETLSIDALSQFFKLVFLAVALIVSIASIKYTENSDHTEEFYALVLFATFGMMIVASANDLILLFCAFELAKSC